MSAFDRKAHWEAVYRARQEDDVSWFQPDPALSLQLIRSTNVPLSAPILDAGGGASRLVDALLTAGYQDVAVLDISGAALHKNQRRLGVRQRQIEWFEQDVTRFVAPRRFSVWHDRAVFHFLTDAADRRRYVRVLEQALAPDGNLIIAAFAPDGPEQCSNLPVVRYDAAGLARELGPGFRLVETLPEAHLTPAGKIQQFGYCRFVRVA